MEAEGNAMFYDSTSQLNHADRNDVLCKLAKKQEKTSI